MTIKAESKNAFQNFESQKSSFLLSTLLVFLLFKHLVDGYYHCPEIKVVKHFYLIVDLAHL